MPQPLFFTKSHIRFPVQTVIETQFELIKDDLDESPQLIETLKLLCNILLKPTSINVTQLEKAIKKLDAETKPSFDMIKDCFDEPKKYLPQLKFINNDENYLRLAFLQKTFLYLKHYFEENNLSKKHQAWLEKTKQELEIAHHHLPKRFRSSKIVSTSMALNQIVIWLLFSFAFLTLTEIVLLLSSNNFEYNSKKYSELKKLSSLFKVIVSSGVMLIKIGHWLQEKYPDAEKPYVFRAHKNLPLIYKILSTSAEEAPVLTLDECENNDVSKKIA